MGLHFVRNNRIDKDTRISQKSWVVYMLIDDASYRRSKTSIIED